MTSWRFYGEAIQRCMKTILKNFILCKRNKLKQKNAWVDRIRFLILLSDLNKKKLDIIESRRSK